MATHPHDDRDEDYDDRDDDYDDLPDDYEQEHRGTLILVLGIVSICASCIGCSVLGVVPWLLGASDLAKMRAGIMDPDGRTNTRTGMILGIISLCLFLLNVAFLFVYFGLLIVLNGKGF